VLFLDSLDGGAWPFLVRGVICLVDSDNERDLYLTIVPSLVCRVELSNSVGIRVDHQGFVSLARELVQSFSEDLCAYLSMLKREVTAGL
jgi:hypothetical protein